jgi:hypothetical protein
VQILEPQTESYTTEQGHYIKTFLISTKSNQAGWKISKCSASKVSTFIGKPFVIIPEHLSSDRQKGHVFANSRDQLLEEYKKHSHGIIESISGPFTYNDGTDDAFYTATIKLNDSKAASALLENGAKTWVPFAVSPHIWHIGGSEDNITDWGGLSLSLVPKGAYGEEAVINKYCKGEKGACEKSLAAALQKQEPVPLTEAQLSDLHAAMRVETENRMEFDITKKLKFTGSDKFVKVADPFAPSGERLYMSNLREDMPENQALRLKVAQMDPKPFLTNSLNSAVAPQENLSIYPKSGVEILRTTSVEDKFRDIVIGDLYAQRAEITETLQTEDLGSLKEGLLSQQQELNDAIFLRESQLSNEMGGPNGVYSEIQGDINAEKMDLDTDGQLISERFGWESASTAMAKGEYGQTNGGIRGITDSSAFGGGGECCIFNEHGGGGCGPCSGRAAAIINKTVSSYLTKASKIIHICQLIRLQKRMT